MLTALKQAVQIGALSQLGYQFARFIDPEGGAGSLAAALLSLESGNGHVCLPLRYFTEPVNWFNGRSPDLAHHLWEKAATPDLLSWRAALRGCDSVSDGTRATPIVLDQGNLYLHRLWHAEIQVANFFRTPLLPLPPDPKRVKMMLENIFINHGKAEEIEWQKVAAAVVSTRRVAMILGGPGTGKSFTVARILALLVRLSKETLRIGLAAPTGKAAARLTESIQSACQQMALTAKEREQLFHEATTIHRLLGARIDQQRWKYHQANPLPLDLLVIDEASMVDLPLMARIVESLPKESRLILLGDSDQLASVESGVVLGELAALGAEGYSPERAAELQEVTGYNLPRSAAISGASTIADSTCFLQRSHRFKEDSPIDWLARVVRNGAYKEAIMLLREELPGVNWHDNDGPPGSLLEQLCLKEYGPYLRKAAKGDHPLEILNSFNQFRLLCAIRSGPFGIEGVNRQIESALQREGLISPHSAIWYCGRPVIITVNHYSLGLSNGDIGIALYDHERNLRVYFPPLAPGDQPKAILPSSLPRHDSAYTMTVHKAQGSEFDHTALLLPPGSSPLFTRELLYTAITRAKKRLTLYLSEETLQSTIRQRCQRYSGLGVRLLQRSNP